MMSESGDQPQIEGDAIPSPSGSPEPEPGPPPPKKPRITKQPKSRKPKAMPKPPKASGSLESAKELETFDDKPFSKQPKATQTRIKQVEALGLQFAEQFGNLPGRAKALLIERSEMVEILQPLASQETRNAMTVSFIEAARSGDEGSKPKNGKARRKAAASYAPKVLADFLPQQKGKQRSGTVRRTKDEKTMPEPRQDEDFDVFVKQCAEYLEEGEYSGMLIQGSDQWKIYANFFHWSTFNMVNIMQNFLLSALDGEMKRQELIES
ncbi:hypothetical protein N431DRAFT_526417 [Stipitochalara longipes BDJ]|nr:hypothetical protein N431DRAFT_526417 [Stipitochalara longipes BDJ]